VTRVLSGAVTRVLSALVLLPIVVGTVWFLPPLGTVVLALIASLLAFLEYATIAQALGAVVPRLFTGAAVLSACAAIALGYLWPEIILLSALLVIGSLAVASGLPGPAILRDASVSMFAVVYIGLPLGALAALRSLAGREAVLLLMATIVVSDSAQYYTGRAFGRTPLAPSISPKKTREGAMGGIVLGTAAMVVGGLRVFPAADVLLLVLAAAAVVASGIVGDLFESLLKRSAGLKDSSALIPGHGGVLDRIDSWLFAAPLFYMYVRMIQSS
jgi:phosphatidate cytidylyltransferase